MILAMWITYIVLAVAVPISAVVYDSPNPDPMVFVFACFFAPLWPFLLVLGLLWWIGKGLASISGPMARQEDGPEPPKANLVQRGGTDA